MKINKKAAEAFNYIMKDLDFYNENITNYVRCPPTGKYWLRDDDRELIPISKCFNCKDFKYTTPSYLVCRAARQKRIGIRDAKGRKKDATYLSTQLPSLNPVQQKRLEEKEMERAKLQRKCAEHNARMLGDGIEMKETRALFRKINRNYPSEIEEQD